MKQNLPEPVHVEFNPTDTLKAVQQIEAEMLHRLLQVCEKHNLRVWAYGGTLLGAIRHRGFIPWDDDIDVMMLREDYDKLLQIGPQEFEYPYFFQSAYTDNDYILPHSQLRRSDTTAIFPTTYRQSYNQGIFIDIFVFDALPDEDKKQKQICQMLALWYKAMYWRYFWYTARKSYVRMLTYTYHLFTSLFDHRKVYSWMENRLRRIGKMPHTFVANLMFEHRNVNRTKFSLNDFNDTILVPFEQYEIPVPAHYDSILRIQYGKDYMTPMQIPSLHGTEIFFDTKKAYTEYIHK